MVTMPADDSWRTRYGGYFVGALAVLAAALLQRLLWPHIPPSPQLLFYPAVLVAARFGGFGPGALSVVFSCLAMAYWFLPPEGGLAIQTSDDALDLAIFAAMGLTVTTLMARMRSAIARAQAAWAEADEARARLDTAYRAREEMLAIVSHDLRSPLASITLSCAQMLRAAEANDTVTLNCARIRRATRRMETLVRNLNDAATVEAGRFRIEPGPVELSSLLESTVELFEPIARQKAIRLQAELDVKGVLLCDRERILQALENIVGNALKFVPREGEVVVAVTSCAPEIIFEVRDSGPGIEKGQLAQIFDRYWKGGGGPGTGLGLYIAKAIVDAHGGRIWATSNCGTTIAFAIPRRAAEPAHARPAHVDGQPEAAPRASQARS
jgi:signal transduction histidine kinase